MCKSLMSQRTPKQFLHVYLKKKYAAIVFFMVSPPVNLTKVAGCDLHLRGIHIDIDPAMYENNFRQLLDYGIVPRLQRGHDPWYRFDPTLSNLYDHSKNKT